MNATPITSADLAGKTVASLPTRPTAPTAFGGLGYTAAEMKAAFDALPLLLVERYNALLADVDTDGVSALAAAIPTENDDMPTLADLFAGITDGTLAGSMIFEEQTVAAHLASLDARVTRIENILGI